MYLGILVGTAIYTRRMVNIAFQGTFYLKHICAEEDKKYS